MAIADMFLKLPSVTGEAGDAEHKGEIEVVSWSWGMQNPQDLATGKTGGRTKVAELQIVKRVDLATPTLMGCVRHNKLLDTGTLTVRKAGKTPLTYFTIELTKVRVTSVKTESENSELVEKVSLGFHKAKVTYTPQDAQTGAKGGGDNVFEVDAYSES